MDTRFKGEKGWIELAEQSPLFVGTFVGTPDLDDMAAFLEKSTERFFRKEQKLAYIVDATRVVDFNSRHRQLQADWLKKNKARVEKYTVSVCFAVASRTQRGILTAIFWLTRPGYKHHFVSTREEAVHWSAEQLRAAHVPVPQQCIDACLVEPDRMLRSG